MLFSLDSFHKAYETETKEIMIRGRRLGLFVPKFLDGFVGPDDLFHAFPLWAKVWEASIVLADHLAGLEVKPGKHFLELGCGLGLVGTVAALFGHRVTMTESNEEALNFARGNAAANLGTSQQNLDIQQLDWNSPPLQGKSDIIMGSEIIYSERDYEPIIRLFQTHLNPGGEILLAEGVRKTSIEFFKGASNTFTVTVQKKVIRSQNHETRVLLCNITPKA